MVHFGSDLERAREERGISLDEISSESKVSLRYLRALEAEKFAELPGGVIDRGIVRSYARAVGLDEAIWLERFREARERNTAVQGTDDNWTAFAENVSHNRVAAGRNPRVGWAAVAAMILGLIVLAVAVLYLLARLGVVPGIHAIKFGS